MSTNSVVKIYQEICKIAIEILKQYDHIDAEKAKSLHGRLASIYVRFIRSEMLVAKYTCRKR